MKKPLVVQTPAGLEMDIVMIKPIQKPANGMVVIVVKKMSISLIAPNANVKANSFYVKGKFIQEVLKNYP